MLKLLSWQSVSTRYTIGQATLGSYGVTPVQYALLKVLWERDNQNGAQLGERLLLDSATMTGLLDRLEHAGLIERQSHATDRRVNRVLLTTRGHALQVPLDREMDQLNQDFLGQFPPRGKAPAGTADPHCWTEGLREEDNKESRSEKLPVHNPSKHCKEAYKIIEGLFL